MTESTETDRLDIGTHSSGLLVPSVFFGLVAAVVLWVILKNFGRRT
jgi:hypothetical protein